MALGSGPSRPNSPLIAVDMDDVLTATNATIAKWHSEHYEPITLADFHYYHYWKNPGWGTPHQTMEKVREFYATPEFVNGNIIDGAQDGIRSLKQMGFTLAIVTARSVQMKEITERWVEQHFPGCFDAVHYTGQFQTENFEKTEKGFKRVVKRMEKIEVLRRLGAVTLIDDSLENAVSCVSTITGPPVPVLLFGPNQWSRRYSHFHEDTASIDYLTFKERQERGMSWEEDTIDDELPRGIQRVKGWSEVVQVCQKYL